MRASVSELWRAFQRRVERTRDGDYESLLPFPFPLKIWMGDRPPTRLLYVTKELLAEGLWSLRAFPPDWLMITRYGIPTRESLDCVHHLASGFRLPVLFVGDLDPLDLTIFAILRSGDPGLSPKSRRRLDIRYGGINDAWLELATRYRKPSCELSTIVMSRSEREHSELLERLLPDLENLIGPRSRAILGSGRKVEMEVAYSPGLYRRPFTSRLISHLRSLYSDRHES